MLTEPDTSYICKNLSAGLSHDSNRLASVLGPRLKLRYSQIFASPVGEMELYALSVTSALMPMASRISCRRDIATV
jgi:hypothetical protein